MDERAEIYFHPAEETLWYRFKPHRGMTGPPGLAHGGFCASILDEAMGGIVWLSGNMALAARLDFRYHAPVKLNRVHYVRARVIKTDRRRIRAEATLIRSPNTSLVRAEGLFLRAGEDRLGKLPENLKKLLAFHEHRSRGMTPAQALRALADE